MGVVITQWVGLLKPQEVEGSGLLKVTRVVRLHAASLVARLGQWRALREALEYVQLELSEQTSLEVGYKRPNSYQLCLKPPVLT